MQRKYGINAVSAASMRYESMSLHQGLHQLSLMEAVDCRRESSNYARNVWISCNTTQNMIRIHAYSTDELVNSDVGIAAQIGQMFCDRHGTC